MVAVVRQIVNLFNDVTFVSSTNSKADQTPRMDWRAQTRLYIGEIKRRKLKGWRTPLEVWWGSYCGSRAMGWCTGKHNFRELMLFRK